MITVSKTEFGYTFTAQVKMDKGVYVWTSNGRVPPADAIISYGINKLPGFNMEAHEQARDEQVLEEIAQYRKYMENHVPSDEELFEMRAAFGPGTEVVNVITGKRTKL